MDLESSICGQMSALAVRSGHRRWPALGAAVTAAALFLAPACNKADAATLVLNVDFPSAPLAIASDEVKFIVYDDPDREPGACQRIYLKRITNQTDLPPIVLSPREIPICELAAGKGPSLELPLGRHSILAVALRENQDLLIGCTDVDLEAGGAELVVSLALPSSTPVPPLGACVSLQDFCAGRAPCN